MRKELNNKNEIGGIEEIIFFFRLFYNAETISINDFNTLCSLSPNNLNLVPSALLDYFVYIDVIELDRESNIISIKREFRYLLENENALICNIISLTLKTLCEELHLANQHFSFDAIENQFIFNNDQFPLKYSTLRNLLISCKFINTKEKSGVTKFLINRDYENILLGLFDKNRLPLTLERLKKEIENNEKAGEMAEEFVLSFEKKRISSSNLTKMIKRISTVDVGAGYDILSFDSNDSNHFDQFIEVKAINQEDGFYFSSNEFNIAKVKLKEYYLYLVDLTQISTPNYSPMIICDPINNIFYIEEWNVETSSFYIRKRNKYVDIHI